MITKGGFASSLKLSSIIILIILIIKNGLSHWKRSKKVKII